jgi:hypothetical protein
MLRYLKEDAFEKPKWKRQNHTWPARAVASKKLSFYSNYFFRTPFDHCVLCVPAIQDMRHQRGDCLVVHWWISFFGGTAANIKDLFFSKLTLIWQFKLLPSRNHSYITFSDPLNQCFHFIQAIFFFSLKPRIECTIHHQLYSVAFWESEE